MGKHPVLLFGRKVIGPLKDQIAETELSKIHCIDFPDDFDKLKRLTEYELVILDYSAFYFPNGHYITEQEVFQKLLFESLDLGTTIVFLHYNDDVPPPDDHSTNGMNLAVFEELKVKQIGFYLLSQFDIIPLRSKTLLSSGKSYRSEFEVFNNKWGASYLLFREIGENGFDDKLYGSDKAAMSFMIRARNSMVLYIPFQRNFARSEDLADGISRLVDSCLTYITKTRATLPDWASEPIFSSEQKLRDEIEDLKNRIQKSQLSIEVFNQAKSLLFLSEYELERAVPKFIVNNLGLRFERNEIYKEDFWILNNEDEKVAICEVKSLVKDIKQSTVFSIINHREAYDYLSDKFPAILFVNANLNEGSFEKKDKAINSMIVEFACKNNILLLRIEDLTRLWYLKHTGEITDADLMRLFLENKGWIEVDKNMQIEIHDT